MTILWRDSMKIGDERLDADHKRFIALLNLTERGLQQKDVAPAEEIFDELQAFVEGHFPAEEAFMEKIGYADLDEHRRHHEQLAYRFYTVLGRFRAAANDHEQRRHVTKLAEFLREWLIEHILKEIIELKPFITALPSKPQTTVWLAPPAILSTAPPLAAPLQPPLPANLPTSPPPALPASPPAKPAVPAEPQGGEWRSEGSVPEHLQKFLAPVDYIVPRQPAARPDFTDFQSLCEAAIWRSVNKMLLFFQRHNENIVRELPPLFIASPEFARNLKRAIDSFILPAMWETRRMRMLLTNFDRAMSDDEGFFVKLGERNTDHILSVWAQTWNGLRLIEGGRQEGYNVLKIKEDTKQIRELLQPSTPLAYDLPKVGNREIEIFKALLDPGNDWANLLNRRWRLLHDYYMQEKSPMADPDIREGSLRDHMIELFNSLPDPWGDFLILTGHRVFPRLDSQFLESFSTNFGRTEAAREAVMPYTMRYLRQVRADPEIRARETAEEEEWQSGIAELRKYRKWRSFGGYV